MRLTAGLLLLGIPLLGGCGKQDEQTPRFNEVLGGTAVGVPTGPGQVDPGVLQDLTRYSPAKYQPLDVGVAVAAPEGAPASEAEAIQAVLENAIRDALGELDFEAALDAFVPEQVAALRSDECLTTFQDTRTVLQQAGAALKAKATGPELEAAAGFDQQLPGLLTALRSAISVTLVDQENAVASFDFARLELPADLREQIARQMAMGASTGAPAGPAGPAAPGRVAPGAPAGPPGMAAGVSPDMLFQMLASVKFSLPFRKVAGAWRIVLPFTIDQEWAELINDGFVLLKDVVGDVMRAVDQAETLDGATYAQIVTQAQMKNMGAIMGWLARFQALLPGQATPPAEAEKARQEQQGPAPREPNAAESGPPRPSRGRRP